MKSLAVASLAVACLGCVVLLVANAQEKAEPKAKESVEVARQLVQELEEKIRIGDKRVPDEYLYTWSRRLADAEHGAAGNATAKQAALAAHAERMKALDDRTQALYVAGAISKTESLAAMYYRITADEWLKRGQ